MEHRLRSISNDARGEQSKAAQYFGVQPLHDERVITTDVAGMAKAYSMALKQQIVARLTGVNAQSAAQLAHETGISQQNLSRWLCQARNSPFGPTDDDMVFSGTVEHKARIIAHTAALSCTLR
jgi:transposase-like protein